MKTEKPKSTHIVTLTPFGAQQYRAMLISREVEKAKGVGILGIPILAPASNYWPDSPKELNGHDRILEHPEVSMYRKEQANLRAVASENFQEIPINMGRKKKVSPLDAARALGFKKDKCQFFVDSVTLITKP